MGFSPHILRQEHRRLLAPDGGPIMLSSPQRLKPDFFKVGMYGLKAVPLKESFPSLLAPERVFRHYVPAEDEMGTSEAKESA